MFRYIGIAVMKLGSVVLMVVSLPVVALGFFGSVFYVAFMAGWEIGEDAMDYLTDMVYP